MRFQTSVFLVLILLQSLACSQKPSQKKSVLVSEKSQKQTAGDKLVQKALISYKNSLYEVAEAEFQQALKEELTTKTKYEILTLLGNIYKEMQHYNQAEEAYKNALKLNRNYETAWVNLGILYRLQNDYHQAEACYEIARKLNPNDPYLLTSMGALAVHQKDYQKAISYFEKSLVIDPNLKASYANLSYTYLKMGDMEKALVWLKKAKSQNYSHAKSLEEKIVASLEKLKNNS